MDGLAAFYQAPTICLKCSAQFCRNNFSPGWKQPYYRWSPKTTSTLGLKPRTPVWCSFHDSSLSPENSQEAHWVELGCPWEVRKRGREEWGEDKKRKERKGGSGRNFHTPAKGDVYKFRDKRKAGGEIWEGHTWEYQELQLQWFISYTSGYIYVLFYILHWIAEIIQHFKRETVQFTVCQLYLNKEIFF